MLSYIKSISTASLAAIVLSGCGHNAHSTQGSLPIWAASPALVAGLSPQVSLNGYGIQPPQGYEAPYASTLPSLQPFGLDMYLWHNAKGLTNASGLSVDTIRRLNADTPADLVNREVNLGRNDLSNFTCTKIESGSINGLAFARAYWQGMQREPNRSYAESGFTYATTGLTKATVIEGYDRVPCSDEPCLYQPIYQPVLPTVEAAALTFRKLK